MDLKQMHSLLAVVDHGSFSAAAAALFTVQSNVSAHVGRLEAEVGTTLLDRRTRELTPAGDIVVRHSREIVDLLLAITDDLAAIENRIIGEVTCGTTPSIGLRIIPPTLARATTELPEVAVSVAEAHSGTLLQQLLSGEIDVAIATGANNPELRSVPLFTEEIVAVVGTSNPLASAPSATLQDLASTKLLLPLQDNPLHAHITQAFRAAGLPAPTGLEVGSSALVQAMAGADVGVALIPATAASAPDTASLAVLPIVAMQPRVVTLTSRATTQPSRALEAVLHIIEEIARDAARSMPGCHVLSGHAN